MTGELRYRVVWSHHARNALEQLVPVVRESGRAEKLAQTIRTVDARLRHEPLLLGEPYRSRGAVVEHLAVLSLLGLDFSVDTSRFVVSVRNCWLMSGPDT
jgi:hypothetical protein